MYGLQKDGKGYLFKNKVAIDGCRGGYARVSAGENAYYPMGETAGLNSCQLYL